MSIPVRFVNFQGFSPVISKFPKAWIFCASFSTRDIIIVTAGAVLHLATEKEATLPSGEIVHNGKMIENISIFRLNALWRPP
jgi:hypothetical protein